MKTLSKDQAISLLVELFDKNKLTFRSMEVLKSVFDEAITVCDTLRSEAEAETACSGRNADGYLPSKSVEDDARYSLGFEVRQQLELQGKVCDDDMEDILVDIIIDKCEYTPEDMYRL